MAKNNMRSFRFSDEVAQALEAQEGSTVSEKFENLVLTCVAKVPEKKQQLKELEKRCEKKNDEFWELCARLREVQDLLNQLDTWKRWGEAAAKCAEPVEKELKRRKAV